MNLKNYFSNTIIDRGRKYYKSGKVSQLVKTKDGWSAYVIGSKLYKINIFLDDYNKIKRMTCNCPYAKDGYKCKHMAAVCMKIEDEQKYMMDEEASKPTPVEQPFKKQADIKDYFYYDLNYITRDNDITNEALNRAKALVNNGDIILDEFSARGEMYSEERENVGRAYGHLDETYDNRYYYRYGVSISFNKSKIYDARCGCPECRSKYYYAGSRYDSRELCEHEIGLLLLLEDYIIKNNPGDATDNTAKTILERYRRHHANMLFNGATGDKENLRLAPRFEKFENELFVSFKIGTGKLYILKNLTKFVDSFENGESVTFGKNTVINYGRCEMDEETKLYYDFIKECVDDAASKKRKLENVRLNSYDFSFMEIKSDIALTGLQMDKLYPIIENSEIEYTNKLYGSRGKKKIVCRDGTIRPKMLIEKIFDERDRFEGVTVSGKIPFILEGNESVYTISDDDKYLERVPKESIKEILPFFEFSNTSGRFSFDVGRKNLAEFYYTTLPILKKYIDFEEPDTELIDSYLPEEAVFKFYLDAEEDNITCKAIADYGEKTVEVLDILDSNKKDKCEIFRDIHREEEAVYVVRGFFPEVDFGRGVFHCDRDEEAFFNILNYGVEELMSFGEVHGTERFKKLKIRHAPKVSIGVSVESSIMDLTVQSDDMSKDELLEVLLNYRKKKKFYRLNNGDLVDLSGDSLETLSGMMDALHVSPKEFVNGNMKLPVYRALYLDKMLEENSDIYAKRDSHYKNLIKGFKTVSDSDFEIPEKLQKTMRNYQVTGYKWLRTLESYGFGGILADDMGLGKTLQTISVFLAWKEENVKEPSIVITPASLVYNWQEELKRFAPEIKVCMMVGNQSERMEKLRHYKEYDVLITSYDLLKRDISEYEDCNFHCQVLDEAQFIKNHTTAAAKSVKLIKSKVKYALTGTPIENRLSELWSIFDYLMPGFLYNYETFKKELETPIVKNKDKKASDRLKKMVGPFILRRLKKDVLKDLPDKLEKVYYAKLEPEQQKLYDAQVVHMQEMLKKQDDSDFNKDKIKILAELTRVRQICCDPSLIFEDYKGGSSKRVACMDLVEQAIEGDHRMLIFSQFTSMLALLEEDLKEKNISYYKITGDTPKQKRVEMVSDFNEGDVPVFIISLKAGGTGLNLTGADIVIHYDPWWNLAVQNQATDRAHRIGQKNIVSVYRLIARDTIEEKILNMQETKKNLADEILSGENGGLASLGKEELLELLGA